MAGGSFRHQRPRSLDPLMRSENSVLVCFTTRDGGRRFETPTAVMLTATRSTGLRTMYTHGWPGAIVEYVRLLPVPARDLCMTEQLIGQARFAQMLRTLNVNRVETIEGGRWVVDPAHRVGRLGVLLSCSRSCGRAGVGIPHARLPGWNGKETGSRAGTSRSRNCCGCPADYRAAP